MVMHILLLLPLLISSEILEMNGDTLPQYLNEHKIVFVAYTVGWCHFSNSMKIVLNETVDKLASTTNLSGSASIVNVDCVVNSQYCDNLKINKFPTMFIYARGVKIVEYREERSVEAILTRLEGALADKSVRLATTDDLELLKQKGENFLVGFFSQTSPEEISSFVTLLNDFYVAVNFEGEMHNGESIRYYKATEDTWVYFPGEFTDMALLGEWVKKVSREKITSMTFQNAEEITSEGKPLIAMFVPQDSAEILKAFKHQFDALLYQIEEMVKFVYVDCENFQHPLYHIGKSPNDCPLLVIDSLAHMFLFPGDIEHALNTDMNQLVEFINDFFSGKLHKTLHRMDISGLDKSESVFKDFEVTVKESKFKQLAPSVDRYSFRDEL